MHSTTIGDTTRTVLTERELRLLWIGLKSLQEFGLPPKCVGLLTEKEVEEILLQVTKACNQYRDTRGPISNAEIAERIERGKWYAHLRELKAERERLAEIERQAAAERWARLEDDARKWRTYDYGSVWRS